MQSFIDCLLRRGYPARFLISSDFSWMNGTYNQITHYNPSSNSIPSMVWSALSFFWLGKKWYRSLFEKHPPSAVLLVMWHPLNFLLVRLIKKMYPDIPVIIWLHEPYKDDKKVYGTKAIIIYLVELFQTFSLRYTNVVIVHSNRALRLFEKRYPRFKGQKRMVPLQFQDDDFDPDAKRLHVSFLGRADLAKGIEAFFSLVEDATQKSLNLEFQIVTASNIQGYLEGLSPTARQKLLVVNKPQISDADLREAAANSLAVLALYKETMQSGIIPLALMKGTPIIGTNIEGITEWIWDGETGVIVSRNPSSAEIEKAAIYIQSHLTEMTTNCRAEYLATFDDSNWGKQYGWMLDLIKT